MRPGNLWSRNMSKMSVVIERVGSSQHGTVPLMQQVPQDVIMWCNSNGIHLYVKAGWQDHQASIAAINDLTLRAITYIQQKAKPR